MTRRRTIANLISFHLLAVSMAAAEAQDVPPDAHYAEAVAVLSEFIEHEVADKGLPALSIALVDDQKIIWAQGFGFSDRDRTIPATSETIYRVGSISKLFTDIAAMQLVERGTLDLDAPVDRYVPGFRPENPFDASPVTLRRLMSHRSGLVREPPIGNYLDGTEPSEQDVIASLAATTLAYPPETRTKYSNGGIAVVGRAVELVAGRGFAEHVRESLLRPMGLASSDFGRTEAVEARLADAVMWTLDGREFPAPTFAIGTVAAGNLYSTVTDLARFLAVLFAGGQRPQGRILESETIREMWTAQCVKDGEVGRFGLGFALGNLDGHRSIGHGGAVYGFATSLKALPDEKLGVAVVTSRDCANIVTNRIADGALRLILAAKAGEGLPEIVTTEPIEPKVARELAGRYVHDDRTFDLIERNGILYYDDAKAGMPPVRLRALGEELIVDDRLDFGTRLVPHADGTLVRAGDVYTRIEIPKPAPPPERWEGLIGEYGDDHIVLCILEKEGGLYALIEWFELDPLTELEPDVFQFPAYNMYDGERLVFTRDEHGRATQVVAAGMTLARRPIQGEDGATFQVEPTRPVADLRPEALAADPPAEDGDFRAPDLVEPTALDPTIRLDIRYATENNFLGTPFYTAPRAFLQRPAAEALVRAHQALVERGYGLLIHDAYRPWHVTKMFHDATPIASRGFVADPARGSRHNRGCAVDLTLCDLETGEPIEMVAGYDEFSPRSAPDYPGGTSLQRWHRDLLRRAMEDQGYTVNEVEWWHFDHPDWLRYPILNATFEALEATPR